MLDGLIAIHEAGLASRWFGMVDLVLQSEAKHENVNMFSFLAISSKPCLVRVPGALLKQVLSKFPKHAEKLSQ